jgi:hypothetical protein
MKTRVLVFFLLASLSSAHAAIKFVGYGKFADVYRFALCDDSTSGSGWLAVGNEFEGYRLASFDVAREELVLVGRDDTLHLVLPAPRAGVERRWESERGAELGALLNDMRPKSGIHHEKPVTIDDYIAVATVYGLVITAHTLNDNEESIEMGVPSSRSDVKGDGLSTRVVFRTTSQGHEGQPNRSLKIGF